MKFKDLILLVQVCGLSMIFSGCAVMVVGAAAAAGAGTVAYIKGNLEKDVDKPVTRVHKAALGALKDLKMVVKSDQVTPQRCLIKAETADKKGVTVEIKSLTELSTKISIRVGVFGDKMTSQMVLTAIQKKL